MMASVNPLSFVVCLRRFHQISRCFAHSLLSIQRIKRWACRYSTLLCGETLFAPSSCIVIWMWRGRGMKLHVAAFKGLPPTKSKTLYLSSRETPIHSSLLLLTPKERGNGNGASVVEVPNEGGLVIAHSLLDR